MKAFGVVKKSPKKIHETRMIITKKAPKIEVDSIRANQDSVLERSSLDGSFHQLPSNRKRIKVNVKKGQKDLPSTSRLFNHSMNLQQSLEQSSRQGYRSFRKRIFEPRTSHLGLSRQLLLDRLNRSEDLSLKYTPIKHIAAQPGDILMNSRWRPSRRESSPRRSIFEKHESSKDRSIIQVEVGELEVKGGGCLASIFNNQKAQPSESSEPSQQAPIPAEILFKANQVSAEDKRQRDSNPLKDEYKPSQGSISEREIEESEATSKVGKSSTLPIGGGPNTESYKNPHMKVKKYNLQQVKPFSF